MAFAAPGLGSMESLLETYPCRSLQIETLTTLLHPDAAIARNLVIYGPEATGKTIITTSVLEVLEDLGSASEEWDFATAYLNCVQCITSRHLFESTLRLVKDKTQEVPSKTPACENLAQFIMELSQLLVPWAQAGEEEGIARHFVLVFDGIDSQREASGTLIPGLARICEILPFVTCVFIVNIPTPGLLRTTAVLNIHFPNYAKHEFVKILALTPPPTLTDYDEKVTNDLWTRFCGTVHDSLAKAAIRTLPLLRDSCRRLWPLFIVPVEAGQLEPKEFSKLLIAARVHFQDESIINPSLTTGQSLAIYKPDLNETQDSSDSDSDSSTPPSSPPSRQVTSTTAPKKDLASLLPTTPRLLLLAAYLASHNPVRHDLTVFSTFHHGKKKRGGGITSTLPTRQPREKHRKIARKLLGAHSFVMERMVAIYSTVKKEWEAKHGVTPTPAGAGGLDGDVGAAVATLTSLRLLGRVGQGSDLMDRGGRWRIMVGWDEIRSIGRSVGLEVEDWLVE